MWDYIFVMIMSWIYHQIATRVIQIRSIICRPTVCFLCFFANISYFYELFVFYLEEKEKYEKFTLFLFGVVGEKH